jgi:hypothetical protein
MAFRFESDAGQPQARVVALSLRRRPSRTAPRITLVCARQTTMRSAAACARLSKRAPATPRPGHDPLRRHAAVRSRPQHCDRRSRRRLQILLRIVFGHFAVVQSKRVEQIHDPFGNDQAARRRKTKVVLSGQACDLQPGEGGERSVAIQLKIYPRFRDLDIAERYA